MSRTIFETKTAAETKNYVFDYTSLLWPGETFVCSRITFNDPAAFKSIVYNPVLNEIWEGNGSTLRAVTRHTVTGNLIGYIDATGGDFPQDQLLYSAATQYIWGIGGNGDYMKFNAANATYIGAVTTTDFPYHLLIGTGGFIWDTSPNHQAYTSTLGVVHKFNETSGAQTNYNTGVNDPDFTCMDGSGNIWMLRRASATNFDYKLSKFDTTAHTVTSYTLGLKTHQLCYCSARNSIMLACEDGGGTVREFSLNSLALTASSFPAPQINSNCDVVMADSSASGVFYVAVQRNPNSSNNLFVYGINTTDFSQFSEIDYYSAFGVAQISIFPSGYAVADNGSCYSWLIPTGQVNCSVSPVQMVVYSGVDASPGNMVSVLPIYQTPTVTQSVTGGVAGVIYDMICTVTTSLGRVLVLSGFVSVVAEPI